MTDQQRQRLELTARMFDLGHPLDETAMKRVMERLPRTDRPSDEELHRAASDELTRQAIQQSFS